ncbi:hypothetical protein, partial [Shouchella clausii]|uniref:hypothetical protein n=1 Tax=Shouchella clausii TaxID=79880 RepID=UPI00226CC65D
LACTPRLTSVFYQSEGGYRLCRQPQGSAQRFLLDYRQTLASIASCLNLLILFFACIPRLTQAVFISLNDII